MLKALCVNDGPDGLQQQLVTPQGSIIVTQEPFIPSVATGLNRAYGIQRGAITAPANGATGIILALATTKVRGSGIFLASVSLSWALAAPPDVGENLVFQLQAESGTGAITLANAVRFGPAVPGDVTQGAFSSNAAAGILVNAGGGDFFVVGSATQRVTTGGADAKVLTWTGILQNSNGPGEVPFTLGDNVFFELLSPGNPDQSTTTFEQCSIALVEL